MELENENKSSAMPEANSDISETSKNDKIEEKRPFTETFDPLTCDEKNINGLKERSTSDRMDIEVFSNESCESLCVKVDEINGKIPSDEMKAQILSSDRFERLENSDIIKNDDEVLSNESDGDIISEMDVTENQSDSELDCMKNSLLDCVAKSDGFFKSQQVGESDLTFSEKREIAENLLIKSLPLFLQRYWKFIKIEDVPYFDAHRSNYDVNFYVNEIIKLHSTKANKIRIKNRRYEALKRMVDEGSYFSDAEMKKRNPFLYDQMIGQHLTEKERIAAYKEQYPDKNFSAFLLNQMDKNIENCLFERQKNEDEAIVEEEDDDSEEESEIEDDEPIKKVVTGEEKKRLRSEFTNIMYESFLDGKDKDFDYSSVDNNMDFDSIHQRDIDEQEKYFDEESSHSSD